jgi:DNA-binding SARP family transcriptional activator
VGDELLRIELFDGIRIAARGGEVRLGNRKARAMLAYLALNGGRAEDRERLAGLLWSEYPEEKARATLRQAVHEAREALQAAGAAMLGRGRQTIGPLAAPVAVDVLEALHQLGEGVVPEKLLRHRRIAERLMAGHEDLDGAFRSWLMVRRQTLHDALMRRLEEGYLNQALPAPTRRRFAAAALMLDPTNEEACRTVMRIAAEAGETSVALRAYEELYRLLDEEFDAPPSAPTEELIARIKLGELDPPALSLPQTRPFAAREEVQAILVPGLPGAADAPAPEVARMVLELAAFGVTGVDADKLHLVQGFRHHLIACLVCFREWSVAEGPIAAVPGGVGSRFLVEGNFYQAGRAIHAVLTLRDRDAGTFAWSHPFELRLDRLFEEQRRLVQRIASSLNVNVSAERLRRVAGESDVSLDAYDRWLRARAMIAHFTPENWNRAATLLAETIDLAPDYSPPYSTLVQMRNSLHIVHPGLPLDTAALERTIALARQAVLLDPRDSRAELCLGWSLALARRFGEAGRRMELACELNPNDSWTLMAAALFHAFDGDTARAQALSRHALAMTLAPNHAYWVYETSIRYLAGEDEAAAAAAEQAGTSVPPVLAWRAAALQRLGRKVEAAECAERFLAMARTNWRGPGNPDGPAIARWFLGLFPIRRVQEWERLRAGIAAAAITTEGAVPPG